MKGSSSKEVGSANLFERLPSCLFPVIFSHLPLRDVFRAHSVCRLWNAHIASEEFRRFWKPLPKEAAFVVTQVTYKENPRWQFAHGWRRNDYLRAIVTDDEEEEEEQVLDDLGKEEEELDDFGSVSKRWLELWFPSSGIRTKLPLVGGLPAFHPPFCSSVASFCPELPKVTTYHRGFDILASAEGLVCGRLREEPGYVIAVGNPLTRTWRKLPRILDLPLLPHNSQVCALMLVESHSSSTSSSTYKIMLFPKSIRTYIVEEQTWFWLVIYDSTDDRWEHAPYFKWSSSLFLNTTIPLGVPFLFALPPHNEYLGVAVYNTTSRSWNAVIKMKNPFELHLEIAVYRAFLYRGNCIVIAVGVDLTAFSLTCTSLVLESESESKAFKPLSMMSRKLGPKWRAFTQDRELRIAVFRLEMEGNLVLVLLEGDQDLWPLMAFNLELSTWTTMQALYHPKFSYENSHTLSPSLAAVP